MGRCMHTCVLKHTHTHTQAQSKYKDIHLLNCNVHIQMSILDGTDVECVCHHRWAKALVYLGIFNPQDYRNPKASITLDPRELDTVF